MCETRGFCDLNVPFDDNIDAKIAQLSKLGYTTVAVNVTVSQDDLTTKTRQNHGKKAKLSAEAEKKLLDFPSPPSLSARTDGVAVLTRLTIAFKDNNFIPIFNNSQAAKSYDLVALIPSSAKALQDLLKSSMTADIVSFVPESAADVRWTRKLYTDCVARHMFFELCYAPCIRDATARRRTISQAHNYHAAGKSRNVILCGGAERVAELRGPHDAANLGFLFGLNEHQGRLAVGAMGLKAVRAAAGRKVGPFRATVEDVSDLGREDAWKVAAPSSDDESSDDDDK